MESRRRQRAQHLMGLIRQQCDKSCWVVLSRVCACMCGRAGGGGGGCRSRGTWSMNTALSHRDDAHWCTSMSAPAPPRVCFELPPVRDTSLHSNCKAASQPWCVPKFFFTKNPPIPSNFNRKPPTRFFLPKNPLGFFFGKNGGFFLVRKGVFFVTFWGGLGKILGFFSEVWGVFW